jgi:hypothetical protein
MLGIDSNPTFYLELLSNFSRKDDDASKLQKSLVIG